MRIYLIRHGQTDWNLAKKIQGKTNIPLNATGIDQAHKVGRMFAEKAKIYPVDYLYTSFLDRAHVTADIIGDHLGMPAEVAEGFHELDLGGFEGLNWAQAEEKYGPVFREWYENRQFAKIPGGEAYNDAYIRCHEGVKQLAARHPDARGIAVVSHGGTIFATIAAITHTDFNHMDQYPIGNLSVIVTEYDPATDDWQFIKIDDDATPANSTTVMK